MGFSVLFPLLAPIGREMGLSEIQITSIIGCSALTVFIASPIWGRISDRWGRKKVLLTGLFGFSVGTFGFNWVLSLGLNGQLTGSSLFLALLFTRILHAAVMSATMPAATAYMADITTTATRTKGMGATGAANNLGSILGPAISGLAVFSLLLPLWLMAIIAFFNGLFIWRFLPESPSPTQLTNDQPKPLSYSDARILPFIIVGVFLFMGFALVQQTMGFRFQDALGLSASETAKTFGIAMMFSAAASLIAQFFVVQRLNVKPFFLLKLAIPLLVAAFLLMAIFETRLWLTTAMMIQGFAMGLAGPGFMAGASLAVKSREQGSVAGIAASCGPLGFTFGPLLGGLLYQINPVLPYACAAGMYIFLFASMQWLGSKVDKDLN
ncbi:MAG: MFS transporter [Gammaproteobacteria bacterium]|jgi:MFS family permease|nr:MFS transporter [Gammaproteobacteria bacterium]MBT5601926.1 MFS transporter [Gammaproteobacteria bacterium]MBT6247184.1 MFS transporter [Gammaproteobacteria bacterium]